MNKSWQPYARHILEAIAKIRRIQARGNLRDDEILYDAALRNLQTLSEATQRLSSRKTELCPDIPWKEISGFRNILVHNYLGEIDPLTIEKVIQDHHLPPLEQCHPPTSLFDRPGRMNQPALPNTTVRLKNDGSEGEPRKPLFLKQTGHP